MAKYDVRVRYSFEGTYKVVAEDRDEAERMIAEDCGLVLGGNIHTTRDDDEVTDWRFGSHPDMQILSVRERDGAGKESVAQRIHYSSERREKPFLAVNCGVIPKELAPSLFFGHVKGTFTGADTNREGFFETARGGTLFLDEVGTLSMEVQSMLLRTLQEGSYIPIGSNREKHSDVRIVAATNEDLQLAIRERRFREDLYHRLGEFEIVLPALHECPEDILPLAEHFREKFSRELKRQTDGFSREAEQQLLSYGWPGNVRELQNKIKRAVLLSKQPIIETVCLNIRIEDEKEKIFLFPENETQEKQSIIRALKICTGNRKRTAEMLHIDPSTLYRKMKKYGLNDK